MTAFCLFPQPLKPHCFYKSYVVAKATAHKDSHFLKHNLKAVGQKHEFLLFVGGLADLSGLHGNGAARAGKLP